MDIKTDTIININVLLKCLPLIKQKKSEVVTVLPSSKALIILKKAALIATETAPKTKIPIMTKSK